MHGEYLWEDDLVDDDTAAIHLKLGELLNQPLCLIQAQELWYADADKGSELGIPELPPNFVHNSLHSTAMSLLHQDACQMPLCPSQQSICMQS